MALPYKSYLFDLDGTLIDSVDLILRCYRHAAFKHLGIRPPDSVWLEGLGTPLRAQLGAVSTDPKLIEDMVGSYRAYHLEHHDSSIRVFPRVIEVLTRLRQRGAKLAVVTSKLRGGAERGLELTRLREFFDVVVTADEVERAKPHPEPVLAALDRLDQPPARAVFIGDSPHDMAAGRAAGVRTAAVLWGPFSERDLEPSAPDFLLRSPEDILTITI